jgi:ornithine cyclodeaminase/alanine dehydrogenase-like protein (mu-crystallin family)
MILGEWLEPGTHIILTKAGKEMDKASWRKVDCYSLQL